MAFDPTNNPYLPGDPYSYDLKWMVQQIKGWKDPLDSADRAKASEEAAKLSEQQSEAWAVGTIDGEAVPADAPQHDNNSEFWAGKSADSATEAKDYADHIADPVSGIVTDWLAANITQPTTPAIDKSLRVSGAGADAKVTGDLLFPIEKYFKKSVNLFDINAIKAGGYYNSLGNWVVNASVNTSNFITIEPGISYFTNYNATKSITYFDANFAFISDGGNVTGNKITPNEPTAVYFVFTYSASTPLDIVLSKFYLLNKEVSFNRALLAFSLLQDSNVLILGDSISATETRWINQFKYRLSPKSVTNLSVSGAHMRDYYNTPYPYDGNPNSGDQISNVIGNQVQKYVNGVGSNTYPVADIIFIFAGTNDNWAYETGTNIEDQFTDNGSYIPTSDLDRKLFAGAMRWAYDNLYSVAPYAPVIWITPIQCAEDVRAYTQQKDKADRIIEVAKRMSCKYIDAFNCSGIYGGHEHDGSPGIWLEDGLHPSSKGGTWLGNYIADAFTAFWFSNYYGNPIDWAGL